MSSDYVWRSADGVEYESWADLEDSHLKNIIILLKKRTEEAQKLWERFNQQSWKPVYSPGDLPYYTGPSLYGAYERRWRSLLLMLEEATRELARREKITEWELEEAPESGAELVAGIKKLIFDAGGRTDTFTAVPLDIRYLIEVEVTDLKESSQVSNPTKRKQAKPDLASTGEFKRKLKLDNA